MRQHPFLLVTLTVLSIFLPHTLAYSADADSSALHTEFMVEMRDGVNLATSVYLPEGDGPWPAVVTRTPYNKEGYGRQAPRFNEEDYVFIAQDSRGKFRSEGEYFPFESDMPDGYDTIEWIAAQPFCNGKVGITGASAMGIAGNLAAAANPPHLVAAFVVVAPEGLFHQSRFIGGVFKESHAGGWMRRQGAGDQIPAMLKRVVMDDKWKAVDFLYHRHKVDIPMYNVAGWYDIFAEGGLNNFKWLQEEGLEGARGNQKILVGPFGHGALSGGLEYPDPGGIRGNSDEEMRWFAYWLKGEDNGIMDEPPVRYYMMAAAKKDAASSKNRYIEADSWPPESTLQRYYLSKNYGLSTSKPREAGPMTTYRFDPESPVPTIGGMNLNLKKGPMDQRGIEERPDYLRFQTPPLEEDVVIAGRIDVELWASTDGLDTDFMVKLVDVYPDGYEAIVLDNPLRARYRHGRNREDVKMMTPGEPEKLIIDLWSTALTFEKGHRIAVHVTSSNFPRFEVNANTGEAPGEFEIPPRVANNTIYYDSKYPSAIVLPVVSQ